MSRFIRTYDVFGNQKISHGGNFAPSALYLLSQQAVPEQIRQLAIIASDRGVMVDANWVRERLGKTVKCSSVGSNHLRALSRALRWLQENRESLEGDVREQIALFASEIGSVVTSKAVPTVVDEGSGREL